MTSLDPTSVYQGRDAELAYRRSGIASVHWSRVIMQARASSTPTTFNSSILWTAGSGGASGPACGGAPADGRAPFVRKRDEPEHVAGPRNAPVDRILCGKEPLRQGPGTSRSSSVGFGHPIAEDLAACPDSSPKGCSPPSVAAS